MFRPMASKASLASSLLGACRLPVRSPPIHERFTFNYQSIRSQNNQLFLRAKTPTRKFQRRYSKKSAPNKAPNPTPHLGSPEPPSFTARLKKLSREYGWTVLGVYLALTVADLPLCLLAVKYIGAERIAHAEHVVVGGAKDLIGRVFPNLFDKEIKDEVEKEAAKAEEEEAGEPTLWTKLGLVFLVHKSFIFIRVPLTAAVTPKVVKTLRSWGYNIGKRTPKTK